MIPLILQVALGQREKIAIYGDDYPTPKVTGHPIPAQVSPRRAGDTAKLVASSEKAMKMLNWKPKYNKLEQIIETAWNWHKKNPNSYED